MSELLAEVVDDSYIRADNLGEDLRLLFYADGTVRFEHVCDRLHRGIIRCAPALSPGHQVIDQGPGRVTVVPSILCDDCSIHGYVTSGAWRGC